MRPLNSDQLGAKGEANFEGLCHDAKLIPNKSTRDRTGWDYIVEWPAVNQSPLPRDRQPATLATLVQVKSVWDSTPNIKVRLSSVERLVKDPRPSFIVIQSFNQSLQLVDLNIVHVGGDFSANVLKRLREAYKDQKLANNVHFSFGISKWSEKLNPTGGGFRQFVEHEVAQGLSDYGTNKTKALNSLGFEECWLSNKIAFKLQTEEELFDLFLGLQFIQGQVSSVTETRFGIPLPIVDMPDMDGVISVQPEPSCKCDIVFRKSLSAIPLRFEADMFLPPSNLNKGTFFKALIKADLFQLIIKTNLKQEPFKLDLYFTADQSALHANSFTLNQLKDFHQLICEMSDQPIGLELITDNGAPPLLTGSISAIPSKEFADHAEHMVNLCEVVMTALLKAGTANSKFKISALTEAGDEILLLGKLMTDASGLTPLSFVTEYKDGFVDGTEFEVLYADHLSIGDLTLAHCSKAKMQSRIDENRVKWQSIEVEFLTIRVIENSQDIMDKFVDRMKNETGIKSYFFTNILPVLP